MTTFYRGFEITLTEGDCWSARIGRAGSDRSWSRGPTATLEEGSDACLRQAKSLVDTFLALNGR
jgi:hypothetical protein